MTEPSTIEQHTTENSDIENIAIEKLVETHADSLVTMNKNELYCFAQNHGITTKKQFCEYVKILQSIDVHYFADTELKQKKKELRDKSHEAPTIMLFSDYSGKFDRFAITDGRGKPLWFGHDFSNETDDGVKVHNGELKAARNAIWLTGKIREHHNLESINLILKVDAQWLTKTNNAEYRGGKCKHLATLAVKYNINLTIQWIERKKNFADKYTRGDKYLKYKDSHYLDLVKHWKPPQEKTQPSAKPAMQRKPFTMQHIMINKKPSHNSTSFLVAKCKENKTRQSSKNRILLELEKIC